MSIDKLVRDIALMIRNSEQMIEQLHDELQIVLRDHPIVDGYAQVTEIKAWEIRRKAFVNVWEMVTGKQWPQD